MNFIYGTAWKEDETARLVELAIETGFRAIDTANQRKHYHEAGVGEGIRRAVDRGLVTRDDLWLQTKFTYQAGQDHRLPYDPDAPFPDQVRQSVASSMEHLGTETLDSFVLHGPSVRRGLADVDWTVWRTMEALHDEGVVAAIGVSNVSPDQLEALVADARVTPAWVQNRCFSQLAWDLPTRRICADHQIRYQGFSLLTANRHVWRHPDLAAIAAAHEVTPAQAILRFAQQVGMTVLTGTTDPDHMAADLKIGSFDLDEGELDAILRMGLSD